ncbi:MAG TPA: formimidoylglutamate deiminase [Steroidobacteraceae bacterium]|nr:formimidoylglutamate deiminase [Steroidobacteraceae bacterium]
MNSSFFFRRALLAEGWARDVRVEVADGVIRQVTAQAQPQPADLHEALVVPGLPNVHSHAFQRALAGLTERRGPLGTDDFWSWRELMYGFLQQLDADDLEAIAAYAYADMLEAGFTSVGEFHYLHRSPQGGLYADPAELALRHLAAARATGIGITLLPVFYEASQFGGAAPSAGQRRFITDLDTFSRIVERVSAAVGHTPGHHAGIAPHSLRAVTFDHLGELVRRFPGGPIHIHAAEQAREVTDCVAACGLRPVEWLLREARIDARWCLIHATHLSAQEITGLAASDAVAGLCPITEANLGDGIFPAIAYLQARGRFAIGTDSHIMLDAAGELRQLEYSQRLLSRTRNALAAAAETSTGRTLYDGALRGGAQALRQSIGAIAPGCRADFVALDDSHPDATGRSGDAVLDTWIFALGRPMIRTVITAGRVVVSGGRHHLRERIDAGFRRVLTRLPGTTAT